MGECCEESKCCSGKESCCESSCSDSCCDEGMSKGKMMMHIANEAWEELMKEKMKAALEKVKGAQMDKAAQVAVEATMAYWAGKKREEASYSEYEDKLHKAMM